MTKGGRVTEKRWELDLKVITSPAQGSFSSPSDSSSFICTTFPGRREEETHGEHGWARGRWAQEGPEQGERVPQDAVFVQHQNRLPGQAGMPR